MSSQPPRGGSRRTASSVRRTARLLIISLLLVAAVPAVASASASAHHHAQRAARVHGRRAHAVRCTLHSKHASRQSRAACRARRLRHATTSGTTTLPVATITSSPAPGSGTTSTSASFSFTRTGTGPFRCSLDGAAYAQCSSPTALHGIATGTHTFSVYAFNDSLIGPPASVAWSVVASTAAPSIPTGLAATAGDTQVSLSWSASTSAVGIAGYRVFRNGSQVAQATNTNYTDSGLANGTTYTYTVEALDASGAVSAPSTAVSATPVAPAPAPAPAPSGNLFASITTQSLQGTPFYSAQCAPVTASKSPRLRGTVLGDWTNQPVAGHMSYLFTLPTDPSPSTYPLEACDLTTPSAPVGLGTSGYYGLMIYVPRWWTIPNTFPYGVNIEEYHFQNVDAAPIILQLHPSYVTLALETGACNLASSSNPGCAIRSNSAYQCRSNSTRTCLPAQYAIPPGAFVQGAWNEIIMHATWATGYTGDVETWYKVGGASSWTQSTNLSGIPTVQYDVAVGTPRPSYIDLTEAYTGALSAPLSLSLGNYATGSSFAAVAGTMP